MNMNVALRTPWAFVLGLGVLALCAGKTSAACSGTPLETRFTSADFATVKPPRDTPVGTTIFVKEIDSGKTTISCDGSSLSFDYGFVGGAIKTAYDNVYETGVPGLGMRVYWYNEYGVYMNWPRLVKQIGGWTYPVPHKFRVELVKTGPIGSGTFNLNNVEVFYHNQLSNRLTFRNVSYVSQSRGCSVDRPVETVFLPTIDQAKIEYGIPLGPRRFSLNLTCDKGVKVAYRIDALNHSQHILLNAEGPDMAQNIGVILLQGDGSDYVPQLLGTRTEFRTTETTVAGQVLRIPLTAMYVSTSSKVTVGKVATLATVTFLYE